jgi:hypothetical protein
LENIDFEKEKLHKFGYRQKGGCGGRGTVKTVPLNGFSQKKMIGDQCRTLFDYLFSKNRGFSR